MDAGSTQISTLVFCKAYKASFINHLIMSILGSDHVSYLMAPLSQSLLLMTKNHEQKKSTLKRL